MSKLITDRERFEAWAKHEDRKWYTERCDSGYYKNPYVRIAWLAWQGGVASDRSND